MTSLQISAIVALKSFKSPTLALKALHQRAKGRVRKKNRKKSGLLPNWGEGGVSDGSKMPNFYFGKVFYSVSM